MRNDSTGCPRITYSVSAPLGTGGMGREMLCSVRAAVEEGWNVRAVTAPGGQRLPGTETYEVDTSGTLRLALLTPARWSAAWLRLLVERAHDRRARRLVGSPQVFQGAGGSCLESLRAAKAEGALTIVESMNAGARHVFEVMRREEDSAGSSCHFHNRWTVARAQAEYCVADRVYCISSYSERTLIEDGVPAAKIIRVPLAVDLPEAVADHEARGQFRVLFVGYLDLRKGFRHLLAAWESLRLSKAELYLRGGTGDRFCRRLVEEWRRRIEFVVDLKYDQVPYHDFSVLVLPSISDGFGLVVVEAMAAGLPVIVTSNVGAADCVREGVDGFIVPPGDPEALADRIEVLYRDRARLAQMGQAARRRAAEFSFEAFRRRYIGKIQEALRLQ